MSGFDSGKDFVIFIIVAWNAVNIKTFSLISTVAENLLNFCWLEQIDSRDKHETTKVWSNFGN